MSAVETWVPLPGYPHHEISSHGRVRSVDHVRYRVFDGRPYRIKGRLHEQTPAKDGYLWASVTNEYGRKVRAVHRMVMEAFVGPEPSSVEVRHRDGDPSNNHVANLVYGTHAQNMGDMVAHGRSRGGDQPGTNRCFRDHELGEDNVKWVRASGELKRLCLACQQARQTLRSVPLIFKIEELYAVVADQHYRRSASDRDNVVLIEAD